MQVRLDTVANQLLILSAAGGRSFRHDFAVTQPEVGGAWQVVPAATSVDFHGLTVRGVSGRKLPDVLQAVSLSTLGDWLSQAVPETIYLNALR